MIPKARSAAYQVRGVVYTPKGPSELELKGSGTLRVASHNRRFVPHVRSNSKGLGVKGNATHQVVERSGTAGCSAERKWSLAAYFIRLWLKSIYYLVDSIRFFRLQCVCCKATLRSLSIICVLAFHCVNKKYTLQINNNLSTQRFTIYEHSCIL